MGLNRRYLSSTSHVRASVVGLVSLGRRHSGEIVLVHRSENLDLVQNITKSIAYLFSTHRAIFVFENNIKLGSHIFRNIIHGLNLSQDCPTI